MSIDLVALGWDDMFARSYAPLAGAGQQPGRVSRTDRGICTVITADGTVRASLAGSVLAMAARDPLYLPAAGDWVAVRTWPDHRVTVEVVLPRRTAVARLGAGTDSLGQVLAANIDTAAVVEPLDPEPDPGRVERLLALVWESGAQPLLLLTKADRLPDPDPVVAQLAELAPGVPAHPVNGRDPATLHPLAEHLTAGRTLGLFGSSGAGKSTLVNALSGASVMATRALRTDGKGRHTTTYRALVPVPGGGAVLDTPGLRAVGLYTGDTGLARAFADITELAGRCRFPDCHHDSEPGCAVRTALAGGHLTARRLASWRKLRAELDQQLDRRADRLATAQRTGWRRLPMDRRRSDPRS